jgi:hypothetical protein
LGNILVLDWYVPLIICVIASKDLFGYDKKKRFFIFLDFRAALVECSMTPFAVIA